ncbi:MAG: PmoA family protein [Akkermansiaceae bacterium]|nr:PmoA family protein [Akkermansiaceae bacterium]
MRIILLTFLGFLLVPAPPLRADVRFQTDGNRIKVLVDGKVFTEYRGDGRIPCLYPLHGSSGASLTRHFPFKKGVPGEAADHPHHVSFWFTHGSVNGHDFWHKDDCRIVHRKLLQVNSGSSSKGSVITHRGNFAVRLEWIAGDQTLLTEDRSYRMVAEGPNRIIDVTSKLTATNGDVVFGDTKEGSFAIRLAPTLRLKGEVAAGHILNSEGEKDGATWGKRARWVAYHGPDETGAPAVVAILDHPSNLRHPTWWHARDYGLLAANPFGRHDFERKKNEPHLGDHTLRKGETLTQKYRLVLHQGTLESARIENSWKDFSAKH